MFAFTTHFLLWATSANTQPWVSFVNVAIAHNEQDVSGYWFFHTACHRSAQDRHLKWVNVPLGRPSAALRPRGGERNDES